jgi:uncharacterized protein YihD (DUF1040 family)
MNDEKTLQDLQTLTAQLGQTGFYNSKGYYTNTDSMNDKIETIYGDTAVEACYLTSPGVKWNGMVFDIDLDKVSSGFRDAVRDKVMISLVNPKTKVAKMATYSHAIAGICDRYIYKIKMRDNDDMSVVISNIH